MQFSLQYRYDSKIKILSHLSPRHSSITIFRFRECRESTSMHIYHLVQIRWYLFDLWKYLLSFVQWFIVSLRPCTGSIWWCGTGITDTAEATVMPLVSVFCSRKHVKKCFTFGLEIEFSRCYHRRFKVLETFVFKGTIQYYFGYSEMFIHQTD